ncbi:hypothetical protein QFC20_006673 [Naganishia adeliensis]|uniref:Uncharacterized protein n=1 Tax=Naganishia adeliensis TaxID=92952 RepID=A0ACC2V8K0_9TREE|nr:hypothetical protein QFC20_006673 [Naganishia adeliensis]
MKFSIALSSIAVAFIGFVSAAPAPGTYANCNSNALYKDLALPTGYAVITAYDNNAANVPGIQPGISIAHCMAQCGASSEGCTNTVYNAPLGHCYPKNNLWDAINININRGSVLAIKGSCKDLINDVKGERDCPSIFQIARELTGV